MWKEFGIFRLMANNIIGHCKQRFMGDIRLLCEDQSDNKKMDNSGQDVTFSGENKGSTDNLNRGDM